MSSKTFVLGTDVATLVQAITTWALMYLDWPFADRLSCYALPTAERVAQLEHFLLEGRLLPHNLFT